MNSGRSSSSKFLLPLLFSVFLVLGILIGIIFSKPHWISKSLQTEGAGYSELDYLLQLIEENYVDSVDIEDLKSKAYQAFLTELDPHSTYLPPIDNSALEEEIAGEFEGIGVQFEIVRDTVMVDAVLPGGPSEKVGIMAGDRIVEVDGVSIAGVGIESQDVVKELRGEAGSTVKVGIKRPGSSTILIFKIKRDKIPLNTVDAAYMYDAKTGFIKLSRFSETSSKEIEEAILKLEEKGMTRLILDLRGNPGGLLSAAIEIADEFLKNEELIVYTQGLKREKEEYFSTNQGNFEGKPLCILVDRYSASASEIVAGAVQDHDRGWIVGERTFGKGLVQEPMPLANGAALTLTVARYFTPAGRCIQRSYEQGTDAYYAESVIIEIKGDTTPYYTDAGRIVFGGGGILPDILVKEELEPSELFLDLYSTGNIQEIIFNMTQQFRAKWIKKYPSALDWISEKKAWENEIKAEWLKALNSAQKEAWNGQPKSQPIVLQRVEELLARNLWGMVGYYQVANQTDPWINASIRALK
ncbi:MAG: S41 family peptidase [Bacteroidetes bacterium]|nr:S41 family peptidase [Bacteroidota bacterium]